MNTPRELKYARTHEWVRFLTEDQVEVGITDFAQDALGDLVYVNLPEVGDTFTAGDVICDVESVKAVSDIYTPVTGTVSEVNEALLDAPETINSDPYGAWLFRLTGISDTEGLLDAEAYGKVCEEEEG